MFNVPSNSLIENKLNLEPAVLLLYECEHRAILLQYSAIVSHRCRIILYLSAVFFSGKKIRR